MPQEENNLQDPSNVELVAEPILTGAAALLGIIPVAGAVAAAGLSVWQTQNYRKLVHIISQKFENIDQTKLNKQFLNSDEFKELTIRVVEAGIRSASDQKLEALANALISTVMPPTDAFSNKPAILRVISQMSYEEMLVLKVLHDYDINKSPDNPFMATSKIAEQLSLDEQDTRTSLDGLQQLGLAFDFVQTFAGFDSRRSSWRITTLGTRCSQYAMSILTVDSAAFTETN